MVWPAQPQSASEIPQTTVADVELFQHAAPVLGQAADRALCELVASNHDFLELVTNGDKDYERRLGTAMLVAASLGPFIQDPSSYVNRLMSGHDLPTGNAPEAPFITCILMGAIQAGKTALVGSEQS